MNSVYFGLMAFCYIGAVVLILRLFKHTDNDE